MTRRRAHPLRLACAVFAAACSMLPLWWAGVSALRPSAEIFRYLSPLRLWTLIPRHLTFDNVVLLWHGSFARAMLNSGLVVVVTLVVGLGLCALAAFGLAALRFRGQSAVFAAVVVSFLIPFDSIAVPLADLFRGMNLQNSYAGLIMPGLGNGLAVFLLRQFFLSMPRELSEAAKVDGLGWFGIFWRIYLPLSRPALISAGLSLFVFQWQSYLWPLLIAPDPDYRVVSVAIADLAGQYDVDCGQMFAGTLFEALLPMLVLLVFQRYFTASIASSGSKE